MTDKPHNLQAINMTETGKQGVGSVTEEMLQAAYDAGNGRRDISHHPANPFSAADRRHAAYARGFVDRDMEIERREAP